MSTNYQDRARKELEELDARLAKLDHFLGTPAYESLSRVEKEDLSLQQVHMRAYARTLRRRVSRMAAS